MLEFSLGMIFAFRHLLGISLLYSSSRTSAVPLTCLHKSQIAPRSLITKIVEYADSGTHRETVEEYAISHSKSVSDVAANTAATGKLICGKSESSANLVIRDDIIIAAGHVLSDPKTCATLSSPSDCKFKVLNQPPVPIGSLVKSGFACPTLPGKDDDWAIFKLSRAITGVKPYKVADEPLDEIAENKSIKLVGASSVDFKRKNPKTHRDEFPKHIQDCSIKSVFMRYSPRLFASNCDGSLGKSGGAILVGEIDNPRLVGISVRIAASDDIAREEKRTGKPVRRNYDENSWYDSSVSLSGDFLKALKAATN